MGFFSSTPTPAPVVDPTAYDVVGQSIFDLIAEALAGRGLKLRRGSASLGRDKWGDGNYHLKFNADTIVPEVTGIKMFVDEVPYAKKAWNSLTTAQKRELCKNHVVSFRVVDEPTPLTEADNINEVLGDD